MPTVPYKPVIDEGLSGSLPEIHPQIPETAFGTNIAQAIEKGGDELWKRAIEIQEQNLQARARDSTTDYIIKAGEKHAEFGALQGKNATDAYPQYAQDLRALREELRPQGSGYAAKLYDAETQGIMAKTVATGAGHAASENKRYLDGSLVSNIQALGDQALLTPKDDVGFAGNVKKAEAAVAQRADIMGWGEDQTKQEVAKVRSSLWSHRIAGLAKTDPLAANDMLVDSLGKGLIRGEHTQAITDLVRNQMHTTYARNVSHDINNPQPVAGIDGGFVSQIRKSEGYRDKPYWDYKQWTSGYGTRASGPNEQVPHAELEQRFQKALNDSAAVVDKVNPNLSAGTRAALTSLTYNAGEDWVRAGLGKAIREGDEEKAKELFLQYNKAGGSTNPALVRRRSQEAGWFGKDAGAKPTLAEKVDRGEALVASSDDKLLGDYVKDRIIADHYKDLKIKKDQEFQDKQTLTDGVIGGLSNGKLPTSIEELTATSPEAEAAWARSEPTTRKKIMGYLATNAKGDVNWSDERLRTYQRLKGEAGEDPAKFLDRDMLGEDIPLKAKIEMVNLQNKVKQSSEGDPRTTKAMGVLQTDLFNAGITKAKDPNAYYQFRGALEDALHSWQEDHKKAPNAEETKLIGSRLLQQMNSPEFWFSWSEAPFYSLPIPPKLLEEVKTNWPKEHPNEPMPTDEQFQRQYIREQYKQLGKKKVSNE